MRIEMYDQDSKDRWDHFVLQSRNGTFMQQRQFLDYHPPGRFKDSSLMVYDYRGQLTAVIPGAIRRDGERCIFSSYPGASHGGIVINQKFNIDRALAIIPLLIEHCRAHNFHSIELRMIPRIYHHCPCDEIDFALRYNGFSLGSTELATALSLTDPPFDCHSITESTKRNILKAEKLGVVIKESNDFQTFWGILTNTLRQRHDTCPTHTVEEMLDLTQRYPSSIKLFAAFFQGVMVSGVVTFLLNSRVINCFYIANDSQYQHLRSLDLLFYKLISWGAENKYHYLDWGISTEKKGKIVNRGLFRFKEKFGGRGVLREAYSLDL
ncbi:MAG: GNAT family N-acetyltransferase [Bacillota bacterium]